MTPNPFSETPIAPILGATNPVIIVGMPRSGSSFLSHLISQINDYYVFDDLYLIDFKKNNTINYYLKNNEIKSFLYWLGWQIRARKRFGLYSIPNIEEEKIDDFNISIYKSLENYETTILDLQEEWLSRLAIMSGSKRWGFKMPRAFLRLSQLREKYPDLKVIFLMREPYDVLKSFKNIPFGSQDGDPRRYHPLLYALYWNLSVNIYKKEFSKNPSNVHLIMFSNMIDDPDRTVKEIANFLDVDAPKKVYLPEKHNTSYERGRKTSNLSGLELKITNLICENNIRFLKIQIQNKKISFLDYKSMFLTSFICIYYRILIEPAKKIKRGLERRRAGGS